MSVSVILPVRDGERFLGEALASIFAQTLTELELVVVDDGSLDGTREVLARCNDARLRVVYHERLGLVAALNRGLAAASGRYVARMDADDVSLPERLARQADVLDRRPEVALVGTGYAVIDEAGGELRRVVLPAAHDDLVRRLLLRNVFAHGSVMLRREAVEAAGGYRSYHGANEDYDLWWRLARSWRLTAVPDLLYRYRTHGAAVTATGAAERRRARERLRDELWREADPSLFSLSALRRDRGAAEDLRALAREALVRGRRAVAVRLLLAAALRR